VIEEGVQISAFEITVGAINGSIFEEVVTPSAEHQINIGNWPNLNLTINQITDIDGGIIM